MSLSLAFSSALSGLSLSKRGTQTVADNISNANTEGYGVRSVTQAARSVGGNGNGVTFTGISRHADQALIGELRNATSQKENATLLGSFWQKMETGLGLPGESGSLSSTLTELDSALQRARLSPDQPALLQQVTQAASDVAKKISSASQSLLVERDRADAAVDRDIKWLNNTLESIAGLNKEIQRQSLLGGAPEALMDVRQNLIDQVSVKLPIREFPREDGRVFLLAQDGSILVDKNAAKFDFVRTLDPSAQDMSLPRISLNGRDISLTNPMFASGQIGANLQIRDTHAPDLLRRLDEFSTDLIERFTPAALSLDSTAAAEVFGIFSLRGQATFDGYTPGISTLIEVNPVVFEEPWRIRTGVDAAVPGPVADNANLDRMVQAMQRSSLISSQISSGRDIHGHVTDILSLLGTERLALDQRISRDVARFTALNETLAAQGVDTDAELSKLLVLEQAYAANARVLSTIDAMMRTLMEI
ncbi:MAG: flagellar hook-associated protein FlgK [Rhodobacteraceae bacterium]|nr:MAG: flagellar hook-associated protein FlgK [Paracoccaceae bacterium]